jgi:PPOX class probable F420-dependent enzyme
MTARIPESHLDLFEKKAFAHVATLMPDGSPQVTPVWVDYDGKHILINSAKGRVKDRNLEARPLVAVEIMDPENGYRYLSVRGRVVEITEDGADAHIDKLALKYINKTFYRPETEVRRIYRIVPEHVHASG